MPVVVEKDMLTGQNSEECIVQLNLSEISPVLYEIICALMIWGYFFDSRVKYLAGT